MSRARVWFARAVLFLLGALLLAVGVVFLANPSSAAAWVDLTAGSELGTSDLRAVYGGLNAVLGAWMLTAAFSPERHHRELRLAACVYGGLALGRGLHLALGHSEATILGLFAIEAGCCLAALLAARHPCNGAHP